MGDKSLEERIAVVETCVEFIQIKMNKIDESMQGLNQLLIGTLTTCVVTLVFIIVDKVM